MKSFVAGMAAALLVMSSAAPSYSLSHDDPPPPPRPGNKDGEAAYRMACGIMWILGYNVCQELPGAPSNDQEESPR